jgi:hypothetical protein
MQNALGPELVRDCNGPRTMEALLRYRGSVFAELFRSLAPLKRLQAEMQGSPMIAALPDGLTISPFDPATKRTREETANQ